ncbi:uncharacterized protein LOC111411055 [Olea europaea subsp. europaea]|uniref:Uncharacterized protein LOC111411055 n=1 Tax=Olea europaea subsp. europaea TaxID=158383 RepID=A0A8S0QLP9_OLEEU|nr:uncharacterized protein LOC111411055 [Olea europaea subsp. europaea]
MAGTGMKNLKPLLLMRQFTMMQRQQLVRCKSTSNHCENLREVISKKHEEDEECWMPHPHTGIYYPKGHEWVMDGIPSNAATFEKVFWFRSDGGVDKLDPIVN